MTLANSSAEGGASIPTAFPFSFGSQTLPGLAKLAEEAGEVGQVIGKLMMTGGGRAHWDGSDLIDRLQEEIADLIAATMFVAEHCDLDHSAINARAETKHRLFEQWHAEQRQEATTAPEAGAVGTTEGREPNNDATREGADR